MFQRIILFQTCTAGLDRVRFGGKLLDIVELHNCSAQNELITYEALVWRPLRHQSLRRSVVEMSSAWWIGLRDAYELLSW